MSTKVRSLPKFPQAGWLPPAAKQLKGFTAKAVAKIKAKRAKSKAASA